MKEHEIDLLLAKMTQLLAQQALSIGSLMDCIAGLVQDIEDLYGYLGIEQGENGLVKRIKYDA